VEGCPCCRGLLDRCVHQGVDRALWCRTGHRYSGRQVIGTKAGHDSDTAARHDERHCGRIVVRLDMEQWAEPGRSTRVDEVAVIGGTYVVMYDTPSDVDAFERDYNRCPPPVGGTVSGPASLHAQS
jgi:hypothetical protein